MGIAKEIPDVTFMVFIPMASPSRFTKGPPELPNLNYKFENKNYYVLHPITGSIGNNEEKYSCTYEMKCLIGENPRNQVGTENPIHIQGSSMRSVSNRGPQR